MTIDKTRSRQDATLRRKPPSRTTIVVGVAVAALVIGGVRWQNTRPDLDHLFDEGSRALAAGDPVAARRMAEQYLDQHPDSTRALLMAATACENLDRLEDAVTYFDRIDDDKAATLRARQTAGDLLLYKLHQLTAAERRYRQALQHDPDDPNAHAGMAYILGLCSRTQEATVHRLQLIRAGRISVTLLYVLAAGDAAILNPQDLNPFADAMPNVPLLKLAQARAACNAKDVSRSADLLREVIAVEPGLIEAHVRLGEALFADAEHQELVAWNAALPVDADEHPRIWHLRAEWAARQGDRPGAVRCEWEAIRRDPNDPQALYQLGQHFVALGKPAQAAGFLLRAGQLAEYVQTAELALRGAGEDDLRRASELAESLGLVWEAYGWAVAGSQQQLAPSPWCRNSAERLRGELASLPLTRTRPEVDPAAAIDGEAYPLPPAYFASPSLETTPVRAATDSVVTFRDDAATVGLNFRYHNGGEPSNRGLISMYEIVGGGIGVLDCDLDGWPDVLVTQGGRWPPDLSANDSNDQLFRNRAGEQFVNVTEPSRLESRGFGQGVTIGDFNGDGFADLWVGNIGPNRLLQNNGDGTFSDVTKHAGIAGDDYTTSMLVADLNGDALPDLFAANYLAGDDLFTRVCGDDKKERSCLPQIFDAAPDQLYVNLGDGRFRDATDDAGIAVPQPGKALGIVAADLEGAGRLSLYLANDVGPNFLFVNQTGHSGDVPSFVESGLLAGVALNVSGRFESGMGIAAGDVDQNGLFDLFVTNFDNETNTLYLQASDGQFIDQTQSAGLDRKRNAWVGWGAQFLDGELDGNPDLILTNGHVNDLRDHGIPFQMPTQYFANRGHGQFVESSAAQLGAFFEGEALGRAVTRIDWNRDGLEDVLIGRLDAPTALLTNTTTARGRHLSCRLVGVRSARDAIGTTVIVRCGDAQWTRQLMAGDGMQASNQRTLVFGLGTNDSVDEVEIRWPSGTVDRFGPLPCDREFTFVEGRAAPLPISVR